jgi:autotransporter-associated beta strand protein
MNTPSVCRQAAPSRVATVLLTALLGLSVQHASAATFYWDTSQETSGLGGTGTWENGGSAFWSNSPSGSTGGTFTAWNNTAADIASFGGSGGTVTLTAPVIASQLQFTSGGYELTGGTLSSSTLTSGNIFMNWAAGSSGVNTISSAIALNVNGTGGNGNYNYYLRSYSAAEWVFSGGIVVTNSGTGNNLVSFQQNDAGGKITLSGAVSSSGGALVGLGFGVASNSPAGGVYVVSSANSLTASSSIGQGTVLVENSDAFNGSSSIALGTSAAQTGQTASLLTNGAYTIAQNISLAAGTGTAMNRVVGGNTAHNSEFTGAITFANGSTTVQLTAASGGRVDFSGLISDPGGSNTTVYGAMEKIGAGVVRLTRAAGNTYRGGTTVKAGTLLLMNTSGSATGTTGVTVNAGATLGGTGFTTGLVTADGAAGASRFAPGDTGAIGTLNLSGGLTATTGATFDYHVSGASIDNVAFGSSALTLDGTVTFNFTSLGSVLTGTTYSLFTGTGTWTGDDSVGLTFVFNGPAGYVLDTTYGDGDGYVWNTATHELSVQFMAAIPEPSSYVAVFAALSLACAALRRRRAE